MSKYTGAAGSMIEHRYGAGSPRTSQVANAVIKEMNFGGPVGDPRKVDTRAVETRTRGSKCAALTHRGHGAHRGHKGKKTAFGLYSAVSDSVADSMFGHPEDHFGGDEYGIARTDLFGLSRAELFGLDYIAYDPDDELDVIDFTLDMDENLGEDEDYEDDFGLSRADLFGAYQLDPENSAHRFVAAKSAASLLNAGYPPIPQIYKAIKGGLAREINPGTSIIELTAEDEAGNSLNFPDELLPRFAYYAQLAQHKTGKRVRVIPKPNVTNVSTGGEPTHQIWFSEQ